MKVFQYKYFFVIVITIILFLTPFFWMKPGEMDLGGDGNRLYYYDPHAYLLYDTLFLSDNVIEGVRSIEPHFYYLPYILVLILLKFIINSPYVLISLISGVKLSLSFLFVYLIIYTLIKHSYKKNIELLSNIAAILGGLFHIFMPIMIGNYGQSLISHNQVFLNPTLFYLLLIYFLKQKFRYLLFAIILSVIFAPNFAWASAPPFFAFFPLAILFLLIYIIFVLKKKIIFRHLVWGSLVFFGMHAFHLIPEIYSLLNPGSYANIRVFNEDNIKQQLNYFYGVLPLSKLSINILSYSQLKDLAWFSGIPFFFIVVGLLINKAKDKTLLLTGLFFLLTLYLLTANITNAGVKLYEHFFYIPGFSMFRNFIGQWAFVFAFFYALFFGQALYLILQKINIKYSISLTIILGVILVGGGWRFINGDLVNKPLFASNPDVKIAMKIDPSYERTLEFIKNMKNDGAMISFPFSDCCYSSLRHDNYAYIGLSPIVYLTGKKDYNGYVMIAPFSEVFLKFSKEKKYEELKKLFGLLHIRYIFHNSDEGIYDETFPSYTYSTVKQFLPTTQDEYKEFIHAITDKKIYSKDTYSIYEVSNKYSRSHFYTADALRPYDNKKDEWYGREMSFFAGDAATKSAYVERDVCRKSPLAKQCDTTISFSKKMPDISYEKVNPTQYHVHVKNVAESYFLVFSETYHPNWNIYLKPKEKTNFLNDIFLQSNLKERQVLVNGYANGWLIQPNDITGKDYTLIIEMSEQRVFYISTIITILTCIMLLIYGIVFLFRRYKL